MFTALLQRHMDLYVWSYLRHSLIKILSGVLEPWVKKVKFSNTRYLALGLELIPVYRQSARR